MRQIAPTPLNRLAFKSNNSELPVSFWNNSYDSRLSRRDRDIVIFKCEEPPGLRMYQKLIYSKIKFFRFSNWDEE